MVGVLLLGALTLAALACWIVKFRRKRGPQVPALLTGQPEEPGAQVATGRSLNDRLIASSELVRTTLIERLGPSWAGKTTEELSSASQLNGWLGPKRTEAVLALLAAADRIKFGFGNGERPGVLDPESVDAWERLVAKVREVEGPPGEGSERPSSRQTEGS